MTEVALQGYGYPDSKAMTTSFQVNTSVDLANWKLYKEEDSVKVQTTQDILAGICS